MRATKAYCGHRDAAGQTPAGTQANEYRIADYDARIERARRAVLGTVPQDDDFDWDRWRSLSKGERFRLSRRMTQIMNDEIEAEVRADLPAARDIQIEIIKRKYGPTLARRVRDSLEAREANNL